MTRFARLVSKALVWLLCLPIADGVKLRFVDAGHLLGSAAFVETLMRSDAATHLENFLPAVIFIVGRTFFSSYQSYIMMIIIIFSALYSYGLHKKGLI